MSIDRSSKSGRTSPIAAIEKEESEEDKKVRIVGLKTCVALGSYFQIAKSKLSRKSRSYQKYIKLSLTIDGRNKKVYVKIESLLDALGFGGKRFQLEKIAQKYKNNPKHLADWLSREVQAALESFQTEEMAIMNIETQLPTDRADEMFRKLSQKKSKEVFDYYKNIKKKNKPS